MTYPKPDPDDLMLALILWGVIMIFVGVVHL